jgi:hypothetical protein
MEIELTWISEALLEGPALPVVVEKLFTSCAKQIVLYLL